MKSTTIKTLKLPKMALPKVKQPKIQQPKLPKLSFGSKKSNFGGGKNYYTNIFK